MDPIYVTGHRSPDTDSIVAAIAYAALRNALGDWDYVPACLGHISDETMRILDRFGYEPPMRLFDVYTQVRDLDYEKSQTLFRTVTVGKAWSALQGQNNVSSVAVTNSDGTLFGMTPYAHKTPKSGIERLQALDTLDTAIGFDVHIYRKI